MSDEVLNRSLYRGLVRKFGESAIEVVARGEKIDWYTRAARPGESGDRRREVEHSGEEYRLRCPFCKDHRPRLYINHRFGVYDDETGSLNYWLAQCFNERCLEDIENAEWLWDQVYTIPRERAHTIRIEEGKEASGVIREVSPPGPMWRLDELAKNHPNHHAVEYLRDRKFDPEQMGKIWGAAYCPKASIYSLASDRIILPIYWKKEMVGWQARYIGDSVKGVSFNIAGVPKYWSSPGFKRGKVAYNFYRAVQHPTVVIVEGMTDVWRVGVQAIGLFGKTMSPNLQRLLLTEMADRHSPEEAVVVILLDPKKDKKDKEHHIERLHRQLSTKGAAVRFLRVYLPIEMDPGGSERKWLRSYIREKAEEKGIPVSFRRPR